MSTKPSTQTLTLRLKHHKTTIFLLISQSQSLTDIATDLLQVLHQRFPNGQLTSGQAIPSDPSRIRFARLVDDNNPDLGWEGLPSPNPAAEEDGEGPLSIDDKSKPSRRKSTATIAGTGKRKSTLSAAAEPDSALALGLKDTSMLAFRFVDADEGGMDDAGLEETVGRTWDVKLPDHDDEEGEQGEDIEVPEIDLPTI